MSENIFEEIDFETLRDCLECPVCLQIPLSFPVPQCENGHILCRTCRRKIRHCPICRTVIGQSVSLFAEHVIERYFVF